MRIYRIGLFIFAFLIASALQMAEAGSLEEFLIARQTPNELIATLDKEKNDFGKCFETSTHLLCVQSKFYPGLDANALSRRAMLQGMAIRVKYALYQSLLAKNTAKNLVNKAEASHIYLAGIQNGNARFSLKGVEFQTEFANGVCQAAASIPLQSAGASLQAKMEEPFFIKEYCASLYPKAKQLMENGKYSQALGTLKELHDLKFANIDAYLLASEAFIANGQPVEACKIALELLADFKSQMTCAQADELGSLFIQLDMDKEAEKAYEVSALKSDTHK